MISFAKQMDHAQYMLKARKMSDSSLRYVLEDAKQACLANPDGINAGYYADECHYCAMEITRREKNKK
jgi:hypothetical protein